MGNSYFKFKQFTVDQERASMKVCTDACVFGAWVAQRFRNAARVLDVGTGTGLLSLMYARQHPASIIDAVEIDPDAAIQAVQNMEGSPWHNRLHVHHASIRQFTASSSYDLIISNPPFFERDLRSPEAGRNSAMHDTSLTLQELIAATVPHLTPAGSLVVLLPFHRMNYCIEVAGKAGLHLFSRLLMKPSPQHDHFRAVLCFSFQPVNEMEEEELIIKGADTHYSERFIGLLKEYYLYL